MIQHIKKVLLLGSGAIRIGQAGEFDYSGSQAIKALKEEGVETILINPNIATIQTSDDLADRVYFLPLDTYFVEKVIQKEKPDGILLGFGGQTALNTGLKLARKGVLKRYQVQVLGTSINSIQKTEDRELFCEVLQEINLRFPRSQAVTSLSAGLEVGRKLGFPLMCRVAYALGGLGSGVVQNEEELKELLTRAFAHTDQVLIEEYLEGWKEIEYEVVRDRFDNCIVVCSMENMDPMGVHTGESIVVAPVQTLDATENFKLRSLAIKVIRHLQIIGECNIQFALSPTSDDYRIIEVNPRLSRSSALASKATGYPLAFIATKLALGYALTEIRNSITKRTYACFEPALDYVVVKHPRWDLQKFRHVSQHIGSEMKSVGEVMAIGRRFEEALQKAIRMLDLGLDGLVANQYPLNDWQYHLKNRTDQRLLAIATALQNGESPDSIHQKTFIDKWYLYKIERIINLAEQLKRYSLIDLPAELLLEAKKSGFSDKQLARLCHSTPDQVRERRHKLRIKPYVKQIDTLAGEFPAYTNYLYLTYNASTSDLPAANEIDQSKVLVLGSGAYRIGSSVEFDWCCVNALNSLKKMGYQTLMINCNPETVSTDYDVCDRLYFEELTLERVLDIYEQERPCGVIVSMGGQIPNNLAIPLSQRGVNILGTAPEDIDRAEDRHKFSRMLDKLKIDQPAWKELSTLEEACEFAERVGYPVLIRPSYVLSGAAMSIALSREELETYLKKASAISRDHPVVISRFITGAKEIEIDAVARNGELYCYAVSEHVENAGVHSGDATLVLPPQRTYLETMRRIKIIARKIARSLNITGPFNIQFIARNNQVMVIECNLRASRSLPFVSKVFKMNFAHLATRAILGEELPPLNKSAFDLDYVGVKAPQFSFARLKGSDPVLGVEMTSTGEVACLGDDFHEAFLKSLLAVNFKIPEKGILLSTGPVESKAELLPAIRLLVQMGYKLFATRGTADFYATYGIESEVLYWPLEQKEPNALTWIQTHKIDLVINIPKNIEKEELDNDYLIRRKAVDCNIPLITNTQLARRFIEAIYQVKLEDLQIKSWDEYE